MARTVHIREIYFYIVCIIALVLFIVGIVTVVDNAITYVNPISYTTRANLLPAYKEGYYDYSMEDINELIDEEIQNSINNEKAFALKSLIRGGIFIIISIPLFIIHWRKAQSMWQISEEKV